MIGMPRQLLAAGMAGFACFFVATGALAENPASFEDAKRLAAERNAPVLIDFYTEW